MSEEMTNAELARRLSEMQGTMVAGFSGINGRLDKVNGRLDTQGSSITGHAVTIAEHRVMISNLNRHTFRRDRDDEPDPPPPPLTKDDTPITWWHLKIAVAAIVAAFAVIQWLPALLKVGAAAP